MGAYQLSLTGILSVPVHNTSAVAASAVCAQLLPTPILQAQTGGGDH